MSKPVWTVREQTWPLNGPPWYDLAQAPPFHDTTWQVGYEQDGRWHTLTTLYDREAACLMAKAPELRTAVAEAGIILEALNISVDWELHPHIKAEIARVVPLIRAAL